MPRSSYVSEARNPRWAGKLADPGGSAKTPRRLPPGSVVIVASRCARDELSHSAPPETSYDNADRAPWTRLAGSCGRHLLEHDSYRTWIRDTAALDPSGHPRWGIMNWHLGSAGTCNSVPLPER
ncbi:hypothetical protein VTK73DRAFT_3193 [Phialemonium thermophilum]|uniref:Uncharacterized protein n=1 Tax=Phialemonium thermophilum TaxID=223376 RepID=A0ABR3VJX4_9PEZI